MEPKITHYRQYKKHSMGNPFYFKTKANSILCPSQKHSLFLPKIYKRDFPYRMQHSLLPPDKDPMGAAIAEYFANGKASRLRVFSSMFDEDEIPVKQLFRSFEEMPPLEQEALRLSTGHILDVGAGSGCHSLALQEMNKKVKAIDISPLSVDTMRKRGVKDVARENFFDDHFHGSFDTILLLMNGSGIVGKISNLPLFFVTLKRLLAPGGCVLMDSSDLRYLFEDEDGNLDIDLEDDYYGEVDFRMQYKNIKGDPFDWLYLDFQTLSLHAANNGFQVEKIQEGEHYDYLAKITRR